jgi:hypothetical protein
MGKGGKLNSESHSVASAASRGHKLPLSPRTDKSTSGTINTLILIGFSNIDITVRQIQNNKQTPWPWSASELYRQSNHHLSEMLVPTFADRGASRGQRGGSLRSNLGFVDGSCYFIFQVAPQL